MKVLIEGINWKRGMY